MASEIGAALTSLAAVSDMAKALVGIHDAGVIRSKVIELQGEIISAQSSALAAQAAQSALLDRIRCLEQEVADLKEWNAEKQKYQLTEVGPGVLAFTLKPDSGSTEPAHSLCSNCYHDGHKAILQADKRSSADILRCLRCNAEIVVCRYLPRPFADVRGV